MATLSGMSGANPRDFFATLGLLRVLAQSDQSARLAFLDDGCFTPVIIGFEPKRVAELVAEDASRHREASPWALEYAKTEKRGTKVVRDLKPPPDAFRAFVERTVEAWRNGEPEGAAYAAAFATDVAVDGRGNTKPTAFHFTAANQQFLDTVDKVRSLVDLKWCEEALFSGHAERRGPNLRWSPSADRAYALMAGDPVDDGTTVCAPLEWLAFRGLPLFPVVPRGQRAETTGAQGRSDEMRFRWPLWSVPAGIRTASSLVRLDWWPQRATLAAAGVIAVCTAGIRRTSQGFGNFGPATIDV